jgi:four helix bundle protein
MPTFKSVEEIDAWKIGRELVRLIYRLSSRRPFVTDFGLRDQIRRRACVSIVSNIAEGFEREGRGEFAQFLSVAKGSAGETMTQLHLAHDVGYLNDAEFNEAYQLALRVGQMIGGLMIYLRRSQIRGRKYRAATNAKPETRDAKRGVV